MDLLAGWNCHVGREVATAFFLFFPPSITQKAAFPPRPSRTHESSVGYLERNLQTAVID
jgi:hypothetical protein